MNYILDSIEKADYVKPLKGHTDTETAHVVDDYPYGFRLRCKIRYWVEFDKRRGYRFCYQTSNPKKDGLVWNTPKKATYSFLAEVLYLDSNNYVQHFGVSEYAGQGDLKAFLAKFGEGCDELQTTRIKQMIEAKQKFAKLEEKKEQERLAMFNKQD